MRAGHVGHCLWGDSTLHNVMGHGTVAALTPLLTGLSGWDLTESQGGAGECPAVLIEGVQGEGIVVVLGIRLSFTDNIPTLGDFTYCDTGTSVVRWGVGNLDNGLSILILFIH